jgi:uncharacterized repeat protein (TIGR01451 family)
MQTKSWQRKLCSAVLACFLITQVMHVEIVSANIFQAIFNDAGIQDETEPAKKKFEAPLPYYDLVAVLVQDDIYNNSKSYEGLNDEYGNLENSALRKRVTRYAKDIESEFENTKVIVIEVQDSDTVPGIRDMLEKLYFEGDGTSNEENSLAGVVLIGEVPLPVVNKNGNYFPSMFPYIDFIDKSYLFNSDTQEFEPNTSVTDPKPEVWHGVIKAPKSGEVGRIMLAEYFDKNHLFHIGESEFKDFDEKLFYADMSFQQQSQNKSIFQYYLNYVDNAEDLVYKRFTNKWFQSLIGGVVADLKEDLAPVVTDDGEEIPILNPNMDLDAMQQAMELQGVPDVYTKDIIEKYHTPYSEIFKRFLSKANDFTKYTGRWNGEKETLVGLISKKDFFTRHYLKMVNDMLEEKIDEIVETDLQGEVPIMDKVVMEGTIDWPGHQNLGFKKTFLNFSRNYYDGDDNAIFINGVPIDMIDRVDQCSLYRGSVNDESQLAYMNRTYDGQSYSSSPKIGLLVKPSNPQQISAATGGKFDYGSVITGTENDKNGIIEDSGAADANAFSEGDIVLKVAGEEITPENSLWDVVTKHVGGEKVEVVIAEKKLHKNILGIVTSVEYNESEPFEVEINGGKRSGGIPTLAVNAVQLSESEAKELTANAYDYGALITPDPSIGLPAVLPYPDPDDDDKEDYGGKYLQEDDIILEIDGREITESWTVENALRGKHIYDVVDVLRYRNGQTKLETNIDLIDLQYYMGGCYILNSQNAKPQICSPYAAKYPVFSGGGGIVAIQNAANEPSTDDCSSFLPYESLKGVQRRDPFGLGLWEEYDGPDKGYAQGADNYLKDADTFYNKMTKKPEDIDWIPNQDTGLPKDLPPMRIFQPSEITVRYYQKLEEIGLFHSDDFRVSLKNILDHFGRMDRQDNDGDWYDTNGNGTKDATRVQDFNGNGILEYMDPATNTYAPLPVDAAGKYSGPYKGEFVGGDWGIDEPDEDNVNFAFDWGKFHDDFLKIEEEVEYCIPTSIPNGDECSGNVLVHMTFTPYVSKMIPSAVKHQEPTNETIMEQIKSGTAKGMPIDDPRYISFILKSKRTDQKIVYPNSFDALNFDDFVSQVHQLETKLNGMAALAGVDKNYSGTLVGLLSNPSDPAVGNDEVMEDAIDWQNMNIDSKNAYALQTYLSPNREGYIGEVEKGYEALYLVTQSDENISQRSLAIDIDLNGEAPAKDVGFESMQMELNALEDYEEDKDKDSGCNLFTCWFMELLEWFEMTLSFSYGFEFQQACGLLAEVGDDGDIVELIAELTKDDDGDGMPNAAENTARLEIETDKKALSADGRDLLEATVTAYDSSGGSVRDSYSAVELEVVNPPDGEPIEVLGERSAPLVNGQATFTLRSTDLEGDFSLIARTTNRPTNLTSNTANAFTTKKGVRLTTYTKYTEENKYFTESGTDMYSITDEDGNEIAKVDEFGNLSVTGDDYEAELNSSLDDPFGVKIVNKETGESAAEVFASMDVSEVEIDDMSMNYELKSDIYGVHVKDVIPSDNVKIAEVPEECEEYIGDVYISEGTEIKGLITTKGQILIDDEFRLQLKDSKVSYIVEILKGNEVLFEVFVSPIFKTVNKYLPPSASLEAFVPTAYAQDFSGYELSAADTDGDDLPDLTEIIIGSSPVKQDTDDDGFSDGEELVSFHHPLKKFVMLFSDVLPNYEFVDEIVDLYKRGILSGYADGTFKPSNKITREEFVKIDLGTTCMPCTQLSVDKKTEILSDYNKGGTFPDTNINSDLLYCVAEAKNRGIVSGYTGEKNTGYFLPQNFISRAEAIKVVIETSEIEKVSEELKEDYPWYFNYVLTAQKEGILPKGRFAQVDNMSSEDFIKFYTDSIESAQPFLLKTWLEDGITRGEFTYMASYILSQFDCYETDTDGDGIPDFLEIYRFATDPNMKDTDEGGIFDLPEIVRSTDPLNEIDDQPLTGDICGVLADKFGDADMNKDIANLDSGIYLKSDNGEIEEEFIFEESDNDDQGDEEEPLDDGRWNILEEGSSIVDMIEFTNEVLADGQSILHAKAEILTEDGEIDFDDNESVVQFVIIDGNNHIEIPYDKVKVQNGIAETDIVSEKLAGFAFIRTEVIGSSLPKVNKDIYAYPDVPVTIDLVPKSYVLKAGGVSKTPVKVILRDVNGNPAINMPYEVTLSLEEGDGKLSEETLTSLGEAPVFDLISSEDPEELVVKAVVDIPDEEIHAEGILTIAVRDDIEVKLTAEKVSLVAGSDEKTVVKAEVVGGDGEIITDINNDIKFEVKDSAYGNFTSDPSQQLISGKAFVEFIPGILAGKAEISALLEGFQTQSFELEILPDNPYKVVLSTDDKILVASGAIPLEVTAELYDVYDNFVHTDSSAPVQFSITEVTEPYATFAETPSVKFEDGKATAILKGNGPTGPVNIVAESGTLAKGLLQLQAKTRLTGPDLAALDMNALYISLLGGPYGSVTEEDYLGGLLTFSGKVQATTTLLTNPFVEKPVAKVAPNGKLEITDTSKYFPIAVPSNDPTAPNTIIVKDIVTGRPAFEVRVFPQSFTNIEVESEDLPPDADDGIYLKKIFEDPAYTYQDMSDGLSILFENDQIARIYQNGSIEVTNKLFDVMYPTSNETPYFKLDLFKNNEQFAELYFVQADWPSVEIFEADKGLSLLKQGTFITPITNSVNFSKSFVSNSTDSASGYLATDPSQKTPGPGFSYESLEDASKNEGVGFRGENKHMLLFSAGNTVGESNLTYASEIGVNLGDPTIHLEPNKNSDFNDDLGTMIYQGTKVMQDLVPIDYDSDGDEDLFAIYEDGEIRLLEKIPTRTKYKDKGVYINITNGIHSAVSGDFDSDGDEDLFVSTKESCKAGETCMYLYRNNDSFFEREVQEFDTESKMYFMKSGDIDNDSDIDIVGSSTGGKILAFINGPEGFEKKAQQVGDLGIKVDSTKNLADNIWIHYTGMIGIPKIGFDYYTNQQETTQRVLNLNLNESPGETSADELAAVKDYFSNTENIENASSTTEVDFNLLSQDPILSQNSYKKIEDLNGDNVEVGDIIKTTIFIKNNSGATLKNVFVNDLDEGILDVQKDSITCGGCSTVPEVVNSGLPSRPNVFSGISIPPAGELNITYNSKVVEVPKVRIDLTKTSKHFAQDEYFDIKAMPEINPSAQVTYFHTNSDDLKTSDDRMKYTFYQTPPPSEIEESVSEEQKTCLSERLLETTQNSLNDRSADSDMDGLPNAWDDFPSQKSEDNFNAQSLQDMAAANIAAMGALADEAAAAIEGALAFLGCTGSCLALPINYAFLVPGSISPILPIPPIGLPAFTLTSLVPWQALPFNPASSYFRMYLSPTLTAGVGVGICSGPPVSSATSPSPANWCFAFAPPLAAMLGMDCNFIDNALADGMEAIGGSVGSGGSSGYSVVQANGSQMGGDAPSNTTEPTSGFSLGNYSASIKGSANIKIPTFPAVIVDWIDRQIENIIDRVTDLPDIYFVLPDVKYLGKEFKEAQKGFKKMKTHLDLLTAINRLPIIDIGTEEVMLKIPIMTQQEINKVKNDWRKWLEDAKKEIKRYKDLIGCGGDKEKDDPDKKDICDKIFIDATKLIQGVEKNLEAMDEWTKFPKKILTWRYVFEKYSKQILCIVDAIVTHIIGWIKKQQKTIVGWIKMIEKIKKAIETWKAIIKLTLEYETSCDSCTTERFSTLELLLKLFVLIPPPPDIPLPKWPNIVLDFSKLQLGLKFMIPDLKFRPAKIIIPPLPRLRLPDFAVKIELPTIPVIPGPPEIPELPDLPPFPLITLPDLPKPPDVPALPKPVVNITLSIEKILKILCLIMKGFIPIPESSLKTQIETLTQRGIGPLTFLDKAFTLEYPEMSYSYVDKIKLTTTMNLQLDLNPVLELTQMFAEESNEYVEDSVEIFNDQLKEFGDVLQQLTELDFIPQELDLNLDTSKLESVNGMQEYMESMNKTIDDFKAENNIEGDELRLVAGVDSYLPSESLACALPNSDIEISAEEAEQNKQRLLAMARNIKEKGLVSRFFASTEPLSTSESLDAIDDIEDSTYSTGVDPSSLGLSSDDPPASQAAYKGLYIFDSNTGTNKKLISYTEEMKITSHIRFTDFDDDTDEDIVFTLDNNIYIKENHKTSLQTKHYNKVSNYIVDDFAPDHPSVNMFVPSSEGNNVTDISFKSANFDDLYGYEFILGTSEGRTITDLVLDEEDETPIFAYLDGEANILSSRRHVFDSGSIHANPGDTVHMLEDSIVIFHYDDENAEEKEFEKHETFVVPDSYINGIQVEMFNGKVEIVESLETEDQVENQNLVDEMFVNFDDEIEVLDGEVIIKYPAGAETVVKEGETFVLNRLPDAKTSTNTFDLENGDYYATVYSFDRNGKRSTRSTQTLLAPQICGDKTPPFPVASSTDITEIILKEFTIDASGSFDAESEITSYGLDLEGDGEVDIYASSNDPVFKLGPYEAPQAFDAKLIVTDEANNEGILDIKINVIVPNITLDESVSDQGFITGFIDAEEANIPIKVVRKRGGGVDLIKTPTSTDLGEYYTDSYGKFRIEDMDFDGNIVLEDGLGNEVGEIYPEINLNDGYRYYAYPTEVDPPFPTHVEVKDDDGTSLMTFFFVADPNTDVIIDPTETTYTKETIENISGVHIRDTNADDIYQIQKITADVEEFGGGAVLVDEATEEKMAAVDTAGNIYLFNDNAVLEVVKAGEGEPFVFQILFLGDLLAEIYVPVENENIQKIPDILMPVSVKQFEKVLEETFEFGDVNENHPQYDVIQRLRDLDILQGYKTDKGLDFRPDQNITRAEFAKIILKILCIYPRESAYLPPTFFSDVLYRSTSDPWYFAILKETFFQGFITGYLGEKDPVTGLPPFKPGNNITRAEATKIIVEALNTIEIIELPEEIELQEGEAWYEPYLRIAVNLKPYEKSEGLLKTPFLLQASESLIPNKILTRADLADLAGRVLDIYNCYVSDMDNDGLTDDEEAKNGLDPKDPTDAKLDFDSDGLTNLEEIEIGTNPFDPDTDDGGANDFEEVENGTEPMHTPEDDFFYEDPKLTDQSGNFDEGVYMELPECSSCPCPSNIDNSSDLLPKDTIFAIISNDTNTDIYSKSNEIQIDKVTEHVQ